MSRACSLSQPQFRLRETSMIVVLTVIAGCSPSTTQTDPEGAGPNHVATTVDIDGAETWDLIQMEGQPIGYQVTRWRKVSADGAEIREISAESHLKLRRFGQLTEETMEIVSRDSLDGRLLSFSTRVSSGESPIVTTGQLSEGQMRFETVATGKTQAWSVPLPSGCGGLFAVETSLMRQPMQAGESRSLTALVPILNVVSSVELQAIGLEDVRLVEQSRRLLHVVSQTTLAPGQSLRMDVWCDDAGQILKSQSTAMQQETFRVDKQVALRDFPGNFDLGDASIVSVDPPLLSPRETRQVRYVATLAGQDPAAVFITRPYQQVTPIDQHRVEILVKSVRPGLSVDAFEAPQDADRQASAIIQSTDPLVEDLARQVTTANDDPWSLAVAIERFVHDYVTEKNFSTAFATAADVARSKAGDCTEHAVLTAAICRARGIPARLALGLVYVPSKSGFAFHMWNEVWVDGEWIPVDATIGLGGIAADHLVLATTSLDAQESFSSFLPIIQTIGQLELQVLEVGSYE